MRNNESWTDILRQAVAYMRVLRSNWYWKEDAEGRHRQELAELMVCIDKVLTIINNAEAQEELQDNHMGHA